MPLVPALDLTMRERQRGHHESKSSERDGVWVTTPDRGSKLREKGTDIWWSDFSFGVYLEIQYLFFEVKA